jgi:N-acetyl-beta-hexosaminidase
LGTAATNQFVSTVIGELAAITPGPYIDIGGDEDSLISDSD